MIKSLRCVIDANIGVKRFIADPLTSKVKMLFDTLSNPDTEIYVPDLFYIEISNVFWKYVRQNLYSTNEAESNLAILKDFPLRVVSTMELMRSAFQMAHQYQISAYDGAYVALSQEINAPFLTCDRRLFNALRTSACNVQFFPDFSFGNS